VRRTRASTLLGKLVHGILVLLVGLAFALVLFLLLPFLQAISATTPADTTLRTVATADVPPPPPPPEQEPEQEEQQPEEAKPPELSEEAPPLDLSQLELALNPGMGGDGLGGDFVVKLNVAAAGGGSGGGDEVDSLFSLADLDQQPRIVYQPGPNVTADMRKKLPGSVSVLFVVDQQGRVENPIVQKSTDPVFEKAALNAVKQWKFEPGKRKGQAVRFRMRVPITFPEK
jgi:protein TonB